LDEFVKGKRTNFLEALPALAELSEKPASFNLRSPGFESEYLLARKISEELQPNVSLFHHPEQIQKFSNYKLTLETKLNFIVVPRLVWLIISEDQVINLGSVCKLYNESHLGSGSYFTDNAQYCKEMFEKRKLEKPFDNNVRVLCWLLPGSVSYRPFISADTTYIMLDHQYKKTTQPQSAVAHDIIISMSDQILPRYIFYQRPL